MEDLIVEYVPTGRESVINGPAGVQVTHKITGIKVVCREYDKRLSNMAEAIKELSNLVETIKPRYVKFTYYLHDQHSRSTRREEIEYSSGIKITDELMRKIGNPFFALKLTCTLDTITGEINILNAE